MKFKREWIFVFVLSFSSLSHAHFSALDTADILEANRYRLQVEPQIVSGNASGSNVTVRMDSALGIDSQIKGILGLGSFDFQAGLLYKWAPIPDMEGQPAMSIAGGLSYANYSGQDLVTVKIYPIISKKFNWEMGIIKPYGSLPLGMASKNGVSTYPVQLALGTEVHFKDIKDLDFYGEVGIDVKDAFNYISIGIAAYFDESGKIIWTEK